MRKIDSKSLFDADYQLGDCLGQGPFGTVYKAVHKKSGIPCAVKIMDKAQLTSMDTVQDIREGLSLLEVTDHPHIARVI